MQYFKKFFSLPGPKDLGKADSNYALPSKSWTPGITDYSWEDWHEEVKRLYPIKYFLVQTLPKFIRYKLWFPIKGPFDKALYYLKSHLIPSKRYHMLDLRQTCNDKNDLDCYRYGWIDTDNRMLYALFNLLDQFVKHELDNMFCPTEEDIQNDPSLQNQKDLILEIKAIHHWWHKERKLEYKIHDDALEAWSMARHNGLPHTDKLWQKLQQSDIDFEAKTDEMIARLMKIRRSLWT